MNPDLISYYKARAPEYDELYTRPDRQDALAEAVITLQRIFSGHEILEVGCGTGYWTEKIANTAQSILATDINEAMLAIARQRSYPNGNVVFQLADYYHFKSEKKFESLFGGFIWSHIKMEDVRSFLEMLSNYVQPEGKLVFIDNNYVEGSSLPITETDAGGNTYQTRTVKENTFRVLKNFWTEDFFKSVVTRYGYRVQYIPSKYYWIVVAEKS